MATITINGTLINDQSALVQDDDVEINVVGGVIEDGLDQDFLDYLNLLGLTADQLAFADTAEAASELDMITVNTATGEVVTDLIFVTLANAPTTLKTLDGEDVFLTTSPDGHTVSMTDTSGDLVGVIRMIPGVDNESADVQMITFEALDHPLAGPPGTDHDDRVFLPDTLKVRAISYIDDSIGDDIGVDDDGPDTEVTGSAPTLAVDETDLDIDSAPASVAANFTKAFGTDGEGSFGYVLSIAAPDANGEVDSGLVDTATDQRILLRVDVDGNVEGYLETDTNLVAFEVTLDEGNGDISLNQIRALVHPVFPNEYDEDIHLVGSGLINVTGTITDADGDTDSAVLDVTQALVFGDDGPEIHTTGLLPEVEVDETNFALDQYNNFSANFVADAGADGQDGDIVYSLSIGATSGLTDTLSQTEVILTLEFGEIVGRTDDANADEVFRISVDALGNVLLNQSRSVVHPNPDDDNEAIGLTDDAVILTGTVTDGDGDEASTPLSIGSRLHFRDDIPSISAVGEVDDLTVDDTNIPDSDSANFADNFSTAFGNDGPGEVTYKLGTNAGVTGIVDTATQEEVVLFQVDDTHIEGRISGGVVVFAVSVSALGVVTLDQARAIVHPDNPDQNESITLAAANLITLTATVTDGDFDDKSETLNLGDHLNFFDDGPSISTTGTVAPMEVDESNFAGDATADVSTNFSALSGQDGPNPAVVIYDLKIGNVANGLTDTLTNTAVVLSKEVGTGDIVGKNGNGDEVFRVSISAAGIVTLDQSRSVIHPANPDPNDSITLGAGVILLTGSVEDGDGDIVATDLDIGSAMSFLDDGPTITADGTVPDVLVDETALAVPGGPVDFSDIFSSAAGADGGAATPIVYSLLASGASGLLDTVTGNAVNLSVNAGVVEGRVAGSNELVFTISADGSGNVTLTQLRAVVHPTADPDESVFMSAANLIQLKATITDGDGDSQEATADIGLAFEFKDDGPVITQAFDGDLVDPVGTPELLANTANATASGRFGWNIGNDTFNAYNGVIGGDSDFLSISLSGNVTGLVPNVPTQFTASTVTLVNESSTAALFNWTGTYDANPDVAGVQPGTIAGTLSFDKTLDTYTITLTDTADGFTKDLLHTSELLSKEPIGNTGHPEVVVEKLFEADSTPETTDKDFYVQFTGNSNPNGSPFGFNATGDGAPIAGDTTFNAGQQISSNFEDWVSATQTTNGVAGDTIQKGEVLTLRFFDASPGIVTDNGAINPTQTANDMAIEFDGIGNSEDLMLVLNLVNLGADGAYGGTGLNADTFTTKAMYVANEDIYKNSTPGGVPSPYASEFSLDNNDGLVIVEKNDYNGVGENWVLQGVQIAQSGNGLVGNGTAINLNKATGIPGGASSQTALVNWDATDNDVLKIVDIAFTATQTVTPDAHLDFAVNIQDADGDSTGTQTIHVDVV